MLFRSDLRVKFLKLEQSNVEIKQLNEELRRQIEGRSQRLMDLLLSARRPVAAHFAAETPQILAVVAWDEGPRFATEIVDTNPEELRVGIAVRPVFTEHPDGGVTLLRYTAAR